MTGRIKKRASQLFSSVGPGLITGAADDDPSGIATYSLAGAQFGTAMLWTSLVTWPLMAPVQMMCARIGMVTGAGLATALRKKFPPVVVGVAAFALLLANTLNVGSDLAGMADAAELVSGIKSHLFVIIFAIAISWAVIQLRYSQIASFLKWLCLTLFAYVITAVHLSPDWGAVFRATLFPTLPHGRDAWQMLVAILGTTISPYLFFWQASQEVETEKAAGQRTIRQRRGASQEEIIDRKFDVGIGTFFSNLVMFFIILATAITLHAHGLTNLQTSREVAEALRPLAGNMAYWLYTAGLLGVGFLAIPTLTGSSAYALAELFRWRRGLDQTLKRAPEFYGVMVLSTLIAVAINLAGINPIRALYISAVVNGIVAPFLLVGILLIASDAKLMQGQPSSRLGRTMVAIVALAMFGAAVGMFIP